MKAAKTVLKVLLGLVIVLVIALLAMPLWFGPVVKMAANSAVPGIVKTEFHLGHLSLNPYTCRFELGDLQLGNPEGCSEKDAATLGELVADVQTTSLMTDVIHVEEIKVKDVFVSLVKTKDGVLNFTQIQYNAAGGKEKYEAAQAKKELELSKKAEAEASVEKEQKEEPEAAESKPAKKVIIDRLSISGVKIKMGMIPIKLPVDINLTDIGKSSNGATLDEVWRKIVESVMSAAGVMGDQLKALGGLATDAAAQATEAATKAAAQATEAATKAASQATEAASKAASQATAAASQATKAVSGVAGDGVKAVGDGAKAVGDGAKKALDSLKSLW